MVVAIALHAADLAYGHIYGIAWSIIRSRVGEMIRR